MVLVEKALFVHAIVQAALGRLQFQAHALIAPILGAGTDRIQVGQCALDLFQDRQ